MDTRPQKWKSCGFSIQVYQKKDSDFQIITSTKCATRWLDTITLVRDSEKNVSSQDFGN